MPPDTFLQAMLGMFAGEDFDLTDVGVPGAGPAVNVIAARAPRPPPAIYHWKLQNTHSFLDFLARTARVPFAIATATVVHDALCAAADAADAGEVPVRCFGDDQGVVFALRAAYGELCARALAASPDPAAAFWNPARYYDFTDAAFASKRAVRLLADADWRRALPRFASRTVELVAATLAALRAWHDEQRLALIAADLVASDFEQTATTITVWPFGRERLATALGRIFEPAPAEPRDVFGLWTPPARPDARPAHEPSFEDRLALVERRVRLIEAHQRQRDEWLPRRH